MDNWITIMSFTYPTEAHLVEGYLESYGIETFMQDEMTTQVNNFYSNAIGGVKLLVKESDYEQCIQLLKEGGYLEGDTPGSDNKPEIILTDESTNKNICPFCHSENISKNKVPNIFTVIVYFLLGAFFPIFKTTYKCFDCEKEWKYVKKKA